MKKLLFAVCLFCSTGSITNAQVVDLKVIDNGSSGPYKAIAAKEATLPDFTVYRPKDLTVASKAEGKLPVIVFGNGGCSNTSITHEKVLSEIASHGYIIIAVGPLPKEPRVPDASTPSKMLIDAIDWMIAQSKDKNSEYFQSADTNKIAAAGQSCGGAQVVYASADPRVKSSIMFNSGMGEMTMAGASKESLKKLHAPIVYIIGGPSDVAFANAQLDYDRLTHVPVAVAGLGNGGHMGTFGVEFGGSFSKIALKWLDWQFKAKSSGAEVFLENDLTNFPGWTVKAKNFASK
ncbi:alpha/beta hydrolase [Segetibacter sp. 3557_3]|uniref:poly(ethylene terephthalate) hydrolase family protein n=1 Tax=Segetibacter sp. 3557_3 TaxID=2547429 RepID=UPI0010587836|nr:alpha/beta hydrolase [Segetibacter sp. 3557_3]TDH28718.1 alpha/beta hydrolase [Segetibacter sp. 3557_3]